MDTNLASQLKYLVQSNTGLKLEKVIEQVLESNLYNTSDILENENVKNVIINYNHDNRLNSQIGANKHYNTLHLFTKQNYVDYKNKKENFIELSQKMLQKLKILTVLDLAKDNKNLSFDLIKKVLDITVSFDLESLIFEAFSLGLTTGKIDQKNKLLKVILFCIN